MSDITPEQQAAAWDAAYPPGTWVTLEGGTLDIGIIRASTRRERWLRPVFWCLRVLHLPASRLRRWAAPADDILAEMAEGYRRSVRLP